MRTTTKLLWAGLLLALAGPFAGCRGYKVVVETPTNSGAIVAAPQIHATPLTFSFQPPADWEVEEAKWVEHEAY